MWSVGFERHEVYLGCNEVRIAAMSGSAAREPHRIEATSAAEGWQLAAEWIAGLRKGWRRPRVDLLLSGAIARPFIFEPVAGLQRWSDAVLIAQGLVNEATGLTGPCDVWMDDWAPNKACLAIAIERELKGVIESGARAHGLGLLALKPWWTVALRYAAEEQASLRILKIDEPDAMTVLTGSPDGVQLAANYVPRPEGKQAQAMLARALLSADLEPSQGLQAAFDPLTEAKAATADSPAFMPRLGAFQ